MDQIGRRSLSSRLHVGDIGRWGARFPQWLRLVLAAALSALALPPVCCFPLLLIAVPVLLSAIEEAGSPLAAFRRGAVFGCVHHMLGLYWITEAILVRATEFWWLVPIAVPLLSLVLSLFIALPCAVAWYGRSRAARLCLLAGCWVAADLARQFVGSGFPWNLWGSCLEVAGFAGTVLMQPAMVFGVHGLTLAVVLWAGTPLFGRRAWRLTVVSLAAWAGMGLLLLQRPVGAAPGITAILVQGNIPETMRWTREAQAAIFQRYLDLTRSGLEKTRTRPAVVIWPETASPYLLAEDDAARSAIAAITGPSVPVLAGSVRFDGSTPYNSLVALDPPPQIAATYDKWHLVPFGEYQPAWLSGLQLGQIGQFGFGRGPTTFSIPGLPPFGVLICYEAIFSGQIVDERRRPAWLVNITNDAWFGDSSGPRQHLAAVRLRAVEEGLPIMRAANTGISAGFDAFGRELDPLPLNTEGIALVTVPGALPRTPYGRMGLALPALMALCVVTLGVTLSLSLRQGPAPRTTRRKI